MPPHKVLSHHSKAITTTLPTVAPVFFALSLPIMTSILIFNLLMSDMERTTYMCKS